MVENKSELSRAVSLDVTLSLSPVLPPPQIIIKHFLLQPQFFTKFLGQQLYPSPSLNLVAS